MSNRLTDTELDELAHLEREATPGPWRVFVSRDVDPKTELAALVDGTPGRTADLAYVTADDTDLAPAVTGCGETSEANADFIAAARNTVVRLIAEVRELRAERKQIARAANIISDVAAAFGDEYPARVDSLAEAHGILAVITAGKHRR
jgi:hypothetical protein